jgi:hypothetical protein
VILVLCVLYFYRDVNGVSGLGYVVQVACRLLDPSTSEFSASLVGKLVTTLLYRTGDKLGDQLELLLRAVLSKLRSADTLSVIQNLLMVYAFLFNSQMEPTLNFLDSVPGPTGKYTRVDVVCTSALIDIRKCILIVLISILQVSQL